ncbi:unnamed protein product [Urochloa humidicola]
MLGWWTRSWIHEVYRAEEPPTYASSLQKECQSTKISLKIDRPASLAEHASLDSNYSFRSGDVGGDVRLCHRLAIPIAEWEEHKAPAPLPCFLRAPQHQSPSARIHVRYHTKRVC